MHLLGFNSRTRRQLAGNICLLLFVAFLTTTIILPVGAGIAEAAPRPSLEVLQEHVYTENNQLKVYMLLKPTTGTHFESVFVDLSGVTGTNQIVEAVYTHVYDSVYGDIYGYAVNLVYDIPSGYTVENDRTPVFIKDDGGNLIQTEWADLTVKPPAGEVKARFSIEPKQNQFSVGKAIDMDVHLTSENNVNAAEFELQYDPAYLQLNSFTPASGLSDIQIRDKNPHDGTIEFAVAKSGGMGKDLDLAACNFTILKAGNTTVSLNQLEVIDIYEHQLACSGQNLNIQAVNRGQIKGKAVLTDRFDTNYTGVTITGTETTLGTKSTATTDALGNYILDSVAGTYELAATAPRCLTAKQTVQVAEGETKSGIDFSLISGDANNDNKVSLFDLVVLANEYPQISSGEYLSDFNRDGRVDLLDLTILAKNFHAVGD